MSNNTFGHGFKGGDPHRASRAPSGFHSKAGGDTPRKVHAQAFNTLQVYTEFPDNGLYFIALFGEGTVKITGGGGGWQSVQRPQDNPITAWRGPTDSYCMEIPLIFNNFTNGKGDVEGACRTLEKMYGALETTSGQPPLLILNANGALPNDVYNFPPLRWVIPDPPDYGEAIRDEVTGKRLRQIVTVKFMHYVAYDEFTRSQSNNQHGTPNTTIVKGGETYNKIAARALKKYGGAKLGNRLAHLNGARDGAVKPKPGQTIKLPTAAQAKSWAHSPRR
jgi:hypothetical protein